MKKNVILYMLCITSPYELNVSKLSSAVGTSWLTLLKYLERMDAGSLIHIIPGGIYARSLYAGAIGSLYPVSGFFLSVWR